MSSRLYRTQILLEPEQQRALAAIARREGRSVSDVVREMVRSQLAQREQSAERELERQLKSLDRIRQQREAVLRRRGGQPVDLDVAELINRMREERDERDLGGFDGRR